MKRQDLGTYMVASALVWIGLFVSIGILLDGRQLAGTWLVMAAGAVFFLLILPNALFWGRGSKTHGARR
ncbi:MAG: hypothetical protein K0R20_1511 [Actinomycetia bacterium]|jgi:hypothetical protein|nr:hypothetical protein [Actinomycetes bacterium]